MDELIAEEKYQETLLIAFEEKYLGLKFTDELARDDFWSKVIGSIITNFTMFNAKRDAFFLNLKNRIEQHLKNSYSEEDKLLAEVNKLNNLLIDIPIALQNANSGEFKI